MLSQRNSRLLCLAVLCLAPAPGLGLGVASPAWAQPQLAWSSSPARVVARLSILSGEIAPAEPREVVVYGNGRVVARYPSFLENAGVRETRLSRSELHVLMRGLATQGLPEFEPAAVRARCEQLERQSGELVRHAGADLIEIELDLEDYRASTADVGGRMHKRVAWRALTQDAARFPEITALQDLVQARDTLGALLARPELARAP